MKITPLFVLGVAALGFGAWFFFMRSSSSSSSGKGAASTSSRRLGSLGGTPKSSSGGLFDSLDRQLGPADMSFGVDGS